MLRPYSDVGVAELAEAAGVTKRTLYKHFPTKEELFASALEARDEKLRRTMLRRAEEHGAGYPRAEIEALFALLRENGEAGSFSGCPFTRSLADLFNEPGNKGHGVSQAHKQVMHDWLKERAKRAGMSDVAQANLVTLYEGVLSRMLIERNGNAAREVIPLLRSGAI